METIPGSNISKSVIMQVINALKDWRVNNHHLYKHVPEAQVQLHDDNQIRTLESAAKHNEPKRANSAQTLKASGASYGECKFQPPDVFVFLFSCNDLNNVLHWQSHLPTFFPKSSHGSRQNKLPWKLERQPWVVLAVTLH